MIDRIIRKILLMGGGGVGCIYSIAQLIEIHYRVEWFTSSPLGYSQAFIERNLAEEHAAWMKWGFFLAAMAVLFIIGCILSVHTAKKKQNRAVSELGNGNKGNLVIGRSPAWIALLDHMLAEEKITKNEYDELFSRYFWGY